MIVDTDNVTGQAPVRRRPAVDLAIECILIGVLWVLPGLAPWGRLMERTRDFPAWPVNGIVLPMVVLLVLMVLAVRAGTREITAGRYDLGTIAWFVTAGILMVPMWRGGMIASSASGLLWPARIAGFVCGVLSLYYMRRRSSSGAAGEASRAPKAAMWLAILAWLAAIGMFAIVLARARPPS